MPETASSLSLREAQERYQRIEDIAYYVELDLTRGEERFGFDCRVEFRGRQPGTDSFLEAEAAGLDLIEFNGRALPAGTWDGGRVRLQGLERWNSVRVRGEGPYERVGLGLHLSLDPADGATYIYADLEPYEAHRVFPCFDQPDLKGSFRFRIRVAEDWLVIGPEPGTPEELDPVDGCRWWSFPATMPLSPYVIGFAAGPFHQVHAPAGRVPMGLYCARSLVQFLDAEELFEITRQGLEYYQRVFRVPYPFSKYDQVFCPEKVNGAMESPGCVTVTDSTLFRGRASPRQLANRAELVLHEMAHMWFGDLVTMRWWDDVWLNESFATLMSILAADSATAFRDSWVVLATTFKALARADDQRPTSHPVANSVEEVGQVRADFDRITYEKGASVLRQLLAWVGEDNFFAAIHAYLVQHREGNAGLADLIRSLAQTSGRDVQSWAQSWLGTVGIDTLSCEVTGGAPGSGQPCSTVTLVQTAAPGQPTLRSHRIRLGLYDWHGERLERVDAIEVEVAGERTQLEQLEGAVLPPLLLPNDGDLTYAKIRLDPNSLALAGEHLVKVGDDLSRAVIWDSLWDMVTDAELAAHRFVGIVARSVGQEPNRILLSSVLANAREAIRLFGAPGRAEELEAELCRVAGRALAAAGPGTDTQLAWLLAYMGLCTTEEQVERCRGFLEASGLPEGMALDLELRWSLVQCLAARGAIGEAEIARALELDSSSDGWVRAQTARAAMPEAEAKARAWARLFDPQCTAEEARLTVLSMPGLRREELLLPYARRLPETLVELMESRGAEFTIELGTWIPLRFPPSPELVSSCRERLSDGSLDPELRRVLLNLVDDAERRLRARALDTLDATPWTGPERRHPAHQATRFPSPRRRASS